MEKNYIRYISGLLSVNDWQVEHCVQLLEEGATVPFISRYRKERTGQLDEVQVAEIKHWWGKFEELDKRKEAILKSIEGQGKLTPDLEKEIAATLHMQQLEDLYIPFRPKRRTRATIAKEKGLEPLALQMLTLNVENFDRTVDSYISAELPQREDVLQGARDIVAEVVSERADIRGEMRSFYLKSARIVSKLGRGKEDEGEKFANYYDFSEPLSRIPAHRLLALLRGSQEGVLNVKLDADDTISKKIVNRFLYNGVKCNTFKLFEQLDMAVEDSIKHLLHPSIENEAIAAAKEKADLESIRVFGENLRQLLLAAPVGEKRTLAIDPGFRTGCKVVCLGSNGELLHNDTIYPHPPANEKVMAMKKISNMVQSYKIEVIAIGNGTAARETENFI